MEKISIKQARKELKPLGYKLITKTFASMPGYISVRMEDVNGTSFDLGSGTVYSPSRLDEHKKALEIFNRIDKKLK